MKNRSLYFKIIGALAAIAAGGLALSNLIPIRPESTVGKDKNPPVKDTVAADNRNNGTVGEPIFAASAVNEGMTTINRIEYPPDFIGLAFKLRFENNKIISLANPEISSSGYPNYLPGDYDAAALVMSANDELIAAYGFGDPRMVDAEPGYQGPGQLDSAELTLVIPYFREAQKVIIFNSESNLSLEVSGLNQAGTAQQETQTYIACGCGCCEEYSDYPVECLYHSQGDDIQKIIEQDQENKDSPSCATLGCARGLKYIYCD